MNDVTEETEVRIILARLEGKLDANLAAHSGDISTLKTQQADHETRIRVGERRINEVDSKPTVSPKQLWAGLGGAVAVAAGIASIIRAFTPV